MIHQFLQPEDPTPYFQTEWHQERELMEPAHRNELIQILLKEDNTQIALIVPSMQYYNHWFLKQSNAFSRTHLIHEDDNHHFEILRGRNISELHLLDVPEDSEAAQFARTRMRRTFDNNILRIIHHHHSGARRIELL